MNKQCYIDKGVPIMEPQNITLYFRNDTSDKVYQASLQAQGQGYVVDFAFGRRGSTLQTGSKTPTPLVPLHQEG